MLQGPMLSETFGATDRVAARVDELQFDLGEGPAWAAAGTARPVFTPDLRNDPDGGRWPLFDDAVQGLQARGLFVFPLLVGPTRVGVLTLYRSTPGPLTNAAVDTATALARVIAPVLARRILTPRPARLIRTIEARSTRPPAS
jgi:GAF domain